MSTLAWALLVFVGIGIGLWLVSFLLEAVRPAPRAPSTLRWAPEIPIEYVEVGGNKLRYVKAGTGPVVVLLHTLRTQLDLFEKVLPELAKDFTVYALDYPGHGYSDIPEARYDADFFAKTIEGFLEKLNLRDVTLAGVSIGGSIALIIASRGDARIARAVAINPYDYAKGRGMARSSILGWILNYTSLLPLIGETFMRLRNFMVVKSVLRGGVSDPESISPELMLEMFQVGNRPGHYRAFISLLRNSTSWEAATNDYGRIKIPVLFIWGSEDWARPSEREHDRDLVPGAKMVTVDGGGHFLVLDKPQAVVSHVKDFIG
jgi:pimeloyl-ACP methyl ester carboxylesterase